MAAATTLSAFTNRLNQSWLSYDRINHDRLGFALCIALAMHAAFILGVSFNREDRSLAASRLEITLAQHRSQQAPEQADFLAQNNQQGSGTLEEKAMLTSREQADFHDVNINAVDPLQQQSRLQARAASSTVITSTAASRQQRTTVQRQQQVEQRSEQQQAVMTVTQRSLEIASLEARLDIQQQAYAKRPRVRRLTSLATKQADDALYLHNWRNKVESIGNQHYPAQARRQQLYGDVRMVVSLLPNGEVYQVKILQSSGHKVLDQAAIKIVHLAAPYNAFPPAMQRNVDVLEIIRTWRFHRNQLSSSS